MMETFGSCTASVSLGYWIRASILYDDLSGGPIQAPPEVDDWLFHYSSSDKWEGSLEQLWVWQNYLDLEAQVLGQPAVNLKPFTETIEQILGPKRSIWIERGHVWVTPPNAQHNGRAARVQLEALPCRGTAAFAFGGGTSSPPTQRGSYYDR